MADADKQSDVDIPGDATVMWWINIFKNVGQPVVLIAFVLWQYTLMQNRIIELEDRYSQQTQQVLEVVTTNTNSHNEYKEELKEFRRLFMEQRRSIGGGG